MTNGDITKQLRRFFDQHPKQKIHLALALGLSSSNTITKWFSRGEVPTKHIYEVKKFLKEKSRELAA
jgi:hypothetical protein